MDVLVLMDELPHPADGGGRVRGRQLLTVLKAAGLKAHVIALRQGWQTERDESATKPLCATLRVCDPPVLGAVKGAMAAVRGASWLSASHESRAVRREVERVTDQLRQYAVICCGPLMWSYVPDGASTTILDLGVPLSARLRARGERGGLTGRVWLEESARVKALETSAAESAEVTLLEGLSRQHALALRCPRRQIVVTPTAVTAQPEPTLAGFDALGPRILMTGDFDETPLAERVKWMIEVVWPGVRQAQRSAILTICATGSAPGWLRRRASVKQGIDLVSGSAELQLSRCVAMACAWRDASGIALPVLGAMAAGRGVVVSEAVAKELPEAMRQPLMLAEEPGRWVEVIARLLSDRRHALDMGHRAREAAARHAGIDAVWQPVVTMLRAAKGSAGHDALVRGGKYRGAEKAERGRAVKMQGD